MKNLSNFKFMKVIDLTEKFLSIAYRSKMKKFNHNWVGVSCGLTDAIIWVAFPVMTRFGVTR